MVDPQTRRDVRRRKACTATSDDVRLADERTSTTHGPPSEEKPAPREQSAQTDVPSGTTPGAPFAFEDSMTH